MQELERGQENHQDPGVEVTFGFHHPVGFFSSTKTFLILLIHDIAITPSPITSHSNYDGYKLLQSRDEH